jgi:hypothetical protein
MSERKPGLTAILPCNHMENSLAFYARLGFARVGGIDDYVLLEDANGAQLHLQPAVPEWLVPGRNPFGLYLYTEQVDELAARFSGKILGGVNQPEDKPWGMYEFALSDPDETLVRIGWPSRLRDKG